MSKNKSELKLVVLAFLMCSPNVEATEYQIKPYAPYPTNDEIAILVLSNYERSQRNITPFVWNNNLGEAARALSADKLIQSCEGHNSCNGELWPKRIQRFYGKFMVSENVGGGSDPDLLVGGWMGSPFHRANILDPSFNEMGSGIAYRSDGAKETTTQAFGNRYSGNFKFPLVPAAALWPRLGFVREDRTYMLNYIDEKNGPPQSVSVLINNQPYPLMFSSGQNNRAMGSYSAVGKFLIADVCNEVRFKVVTGTGEVIYYPENYSISAVSATSLAAYQAIKPHCPDRLNFVPPQEPPSDASHVLITKRLEEPVNQGRGLKITYLFKCFLDDKPVQGCKIDFTIQKQSGISKKKLIYRKLKTNKDGYTVINLGFNLKNDANSHFGFEFGSTLSPVGDTLVREDLNDLNIRIP